MNRSAFFLLTFFLLLAPAAQAETIPEAKKNLPKLYGFSPTTALQNSTMYFRAKIEDNLPFKSCELFVNDKKVQTMTLRGDVALGTYKFTTIGNIPVRIKCTDADDVIVEADNKSVVVSAPNPSVKPGDLIKMGCPAVVYPNHPCTAVYYYGVDGKRHAFSNEPVYKSWFKNFDDLIIVSENVMSGIPLGRNVTYRPGNRLIKFSTSTVYAISYGGFLRPIANGEIAQSIYGDKWVSLIEGVDDVFFKNYTMGSLIESTNDFVWSKAMGETSTIDKTL